MCLPSALRLHHRGLSKMKDSGVRVPRNFSTVPIPIANEEQKANREKRGGRGGKYTH